MFMFVFAQSSLWNVLIVLIGICRKTERNVKGELSLLKYQAQK